MQIENKSIEEITIGKERYKALLEIEKNYFELLTWNKKKGKAYERMKNLRDFDKDSMKYAPYRQIKKNFIESTGKEF